MNSIRYGNFRLEVTAEGGSRVNRLSQRASPGVLRPARAGESTPALPPGRGEQVEVARQAVRAQRPAGFYATCGYGKTTLLRYVAGTAVAEGLAGSSVYLRAGPGGLHDLLHRLVGELYAADEPVKLTPEECAEALGQVQALVALDDMSLTRSQADYLLSVLSGCSVLLGSQHPVLSQPGSSQQLAGLPGDVALQLVVGDLGRPLSSEEMSAVRRLIDAVDGQPLHLRQATALAREQGLSFEELATMAERDPGALDRRSIGALGERYRRALAILTIAAGALLPPGLVEAMGSIAEIGECLSLLHRRGLAEQQQDQFGLPACKTESYRQILQGDVHHVAGLREFASWLAARDPSSAGSLSAASGALAITEWAAEEGEWSGIVDVIRVAEPVLTLAGHWEASREALTHGLKAATETADHLSEALFAHQQGSLALCLGEFTSAEQLLSRALHLREQYGDSRGAEVTRHNLSLLRSPAPPPPQRRRRPRDVRKLAALVGGGALTLLALTAGVVKELPTGSTTTTPPPASSPTPTPTFTPSPSATAGNLGGGNNNQQGTRATGVDPPEMARGAGTGSSNDGQVSSPPSVQSVGFGQADIASAALAPTPHRDRQCQQPQRTAARDQERTDLGPVHRHRGQLRARDPTPRLVHDLGAVRTRRPRPGNRDITVDSSAGPATARLTGTGYAEVSVTVTGSGSVSGSGINCASIGTGPDTGTCSAQITTAQVSLTANPGKTDIGVVWGGCQGTQEDTCSLSVTRDEDVSATFAVIGGSASPAPPGKGD